MKRRIIILDHNRGRLANLLWNSASIFAYCCEKGYSLENYSFPPPYQKFFTFNISHPIVKLFFFSSFKDTLLSKKLRLYHRYSQFIKLTHKKSILSSESSMGYFFCLPPSHSEDQNQFKKVEEIEASSFETFYFTGGLFRNPDGMRKYHSDIQKYFRPQESIMSSVENFSASLRTKYSHIVGVHMRQKDYRTFYNGKYYFTPNEVAATLEDYLKKNKKSRTETLFIICSDGDVDLLIFKDLQVTKGLGGIVEDLFTLSMTDLVIGSQSTYGMFGAYYGNIPIVFFKRGGVNWEKLKIDEGYQFPSENLSGEKAVCKTCGSLVELFIQEAFDDRYGCPKYFDILMCKNCGMFQTHPPLLKEEIADLYTHYYPRKDINPKKIRDNFTPEFGFVARIKRWFSGNHRIHFDLPLSSDNKKILEIGCGDGGSLLQLKAMGYDAYGVETDENIRKVRDELHLSIHIGTIEDANFEPKQFDYIIANQLLEHIIDLESFMESCRKLLKDDGTIIFSTPNANSIYRKLCRKEWINWHIPYHQQVFTKKSLAILLQKHKLSITGIKTVTPTAWTIHQLHMLRSNQIMGVKNPYWNKKESTNDEKKKGSSFVKRIIFLPKRIVYIIVTFSINTCNKIIDILQQGDCLIITIKK